jgi:hypothetical protein
MRYPDDLLKSPVARITPERVRGFIDSLSAEIRPTSLVIVLDNLCYAARLIAPRGDWGWLASIKARLAARAKPEDRFDRFVPAWYTLDLGIELMDSRLVVGELPGPDQALRHAHRHARVVPKGHSPC